MLFGILIILGIILFLTTIFLKGGWRGVAAILGMVCILAGVWGGGLKWLLGG